jgi:transposase
MDMSAAYVKATKQFIPLAEGKIVHDRFHVMQLATKAVDKVRRGEHRRLKQDDDNRLFCPPSPHNPEFQNVLIALSWSGSSRSGRSNSDR